MEVATATIQEAKALQMKVHEAMEKADDVSDEVKDLLNLADSQLAKALELYNKKDYSEAITLAKKAIQYYQEILQKVT